jgi:hypothetical protein
MDPREVGQQGDDWMHLAQDRDQWWNCEQGNEPLGSIKVGESLD